MPQSKSPPLFFLQTHFTPCFSLDDDNSLRWRRDTAHSHHSAFFPPPPPTTPFMVYIAVLLSASPPEILPQILPQQELPVTLLTWLQPPSPPLFLCSLTCQPPYFFFFFFFGWVNPLILGGFRFIKPTPRHRHPIQCIGPDTPSSPPPQFPLSTVFLSFQKPSPAAQQLLWAASVPTA